jgi:hypothetical protein
MDRRREQLVQTIANCAVEFDILIDRNVLSLLHGNLPMPPSAGTPVMVDDCGRQNPAEPSAYGAHIAQIRRALQGTDRKALQSLFSFVRVAEPPVKKG